MRLDESAQFSGRRQELIRFLSQGDITVDLPRAGLQPKRPVDNIAEGRVIREKSAADIANRSKA